MKKQSRFRRFLIKLLRASLTKLHGKHDITLQDFYDRIEALAKKEGSTHFEVRIFKSPHSPSVEFAAYMAGFKWTSGHLSIESVIEDLLSCRYHKEGIIENVLI